MPINLVTDIPLDDDQKARVLRMAFGNGHVDYENRYRNQDNEACTLKQVHFTTKPIDGVHDGNTTIDSIDAIRFETPPCLYFEDTSGALTGYRAAREVTQSQWHYGLLFFDDNGDPWFTGRQVPGADDRINAQEPILRRISLETPEMVQHTNGVIGENIPAEGEFWLTDTDPAIVTSIPWWGGFAEEPRPDWPGGIENAEAEKEILRQVRMRVQSLDEEPGPG